MALQARDGKLLWQTDPGGSFPHHRNDYHRVYIASSESTSVDVRDTPPLKGASARSACKSGINHAELQLSTLSEERSAPRPSRLRCRRDGKIYALDKDSGTILWATHSAGRLHLTRLLRMKRIYIGKISASSSLSMRNLEPVWRYQTRSALRGSASLSGQTLFIGSADNYVYAINRESGRLLCGLAPGLRCRRSPCRKRSRRRVARQFYNFLSFARGNRLWKRQMPGRCDSSAPCQGEFRTLHSLSGDSASL